MTSEQIKVISAALSKFNEATQELQTALSESGYQLEGAPSDMQDIEDFAYDVLTMVEEELELLSEKELKNNNGEDNSVSTRQTA